MVKQRFPHKVLPGYPKEFKFEKIEDLREYFGRGDSITCLRCGKEYRSLGVHLRAVHQMTPDEYREIYGIPWRYGLCCKETSEIKREQAEHMLAVGILLPQSPEGLREAQMAKRRRYVKIRNEIACENLEICNKDKTGEATRRKNSRPKFGTKEYTEMRRRVVSPNFVNWWKGKEQTDEHVFKRTGYHKKEAAGDGSPGAGEEKA